MKGKKKMRVGMWEVGNEGERNGRMEGREG